VYKRLQNSVMVTIHCTEGIILTAVHGENIGLCDLESGELLEIYSETRDDFDRLDQYINIGDNIFLYFPHIRVILL